MTFERKEPGAPPASDGSSPGGERPLPPWLEVGAAWGGRALVLVAVAALAVLALSQLLLLLVPVLVALFLASVLYEPTLVLRRRLPDVAASLVVVAGFGAAVVALLALVVVPAAGEAATVGSTLQTGLARAAGVLAPFGISPDQLVQGVNAAAQQLLGGGGAGAALQGLGTAASLFGGSVLVLVVLFFFLKEGERIWGGALAVLGGPRRETLERFGHRAWGTLRAYFLGVTTVAALDALFIGLVLLAVGVPFVLPLAVLTFVAAYFPVVGAVVSGLVAALIALVTAGPIPAAIVAGAFLVLQQLEGNVLYPWVMHGRVAIHPLTTILSVAAGAKLAGVLGAFLAVPVAAVISGTAREEAADGVLQADGGAAGPGEGESGAEGGADPEATPAASPGGARKDA